MPKIKKTLLWLYFNPERDGTGWDWEKKKKAIIILIHSIPTRNRDFQKISKKIQKIKKHQYGFFSSQNGTGEAENMRKKKFSFWSIPTRHGVGNSRKIAKKLKKLKNINMASFQAKTGWGRLKMWEKKFSFWSIPTRPIIWNSRKIAKKVKKLENIIVASFQAKMGRDRLRMREKKYSRSDPFQPNTE